MGYDPSALEHPPAADQPEFYAYTRRDEEQSNLLRQVVPFVFAVCGGLAVIFLFFAAMGAVDLGDAIVATVVATIMGLVWFSGFYVRHRTGAGRVQWRDRERRGF
jgi:hypothetical protein